MRWEDERYVRFFTRDTPEFMALSWQARGLFGLIMRKVDRAGILAVGKLGLKGVAVAVGGPWADIEAPLRELLDDGCVAFAESIGKVILPNFMEAQEASQSDAARKRASREKAKAEFGGTVSASEAAREVTNRDSMQSQNVTESHTRSHAVTRGHVESHAVTPVLSQTGPSQTGPDQKEKKKSVELSPSESPTTPIASKSHIQTVFDHWKVVMKRNATSRLDGKRTAAIKRAIEAYGVPDCLRAIDGCAKSDFHMGRDPKTNGTKHNDVELIFRDAKHTEQFLPSPAKRNPAQETPTLAFLSPEEVERRKASLRVAMATGVAPAPQESPSVIVVSVGSSGSAATPARPLSAPGIGHLLSDAGTALEVSNG